MPVGEIGVCLTRFLIRVRITIRSWQSILLFILMQRQEQNSSEHMQQEAKGLILGRFLHVHTDNAPDHINCPCQSTVLSSLYLHFICHIRRWLSFRKTETKYRDQVTHNSIQTPLKLAALETQNLAISMNRQGREGTEELSVMRFRQDELDDAEKQTSTQLQCPSKSDGSHDFMNQEPYHGLEAGTSSWFGGTSGPPAHLFPELCPQNHWPLTS